MPAFISPLDGNYIALKRAALLIAREQPGIEPDEIMELFKHAIFTGEFEREECRVEGIERTDDRNLLLLRIEAPPTNHLHRLPLDAQPQEYFAVKGATVAEILSERDALPGRAEDWAAFAQFPRDAAAMKTHSARWRTSPIPPFQQEGRLSSAISGWRRSSFGRG